ARTARPRRPPVADRNNLEGVKREHGFGRIGTDRHGFYPSSSVASAPIRVPSPISLKPSGGGGRALVAPCGAARDLARDGENLRRVEGLRDHPVHTRGAALAGADGVAPARDDGERHRPVALAYGAGQLPP